MELEVDKNENLSFGSFLKAARSKKGVSLEALYEETCISPLRLKALETEDHEQLPAQVFVKGFIRSYAKAVGADGNRAIELYEQSLSSRYVPVRADPELHLKKRSLWPKVALSLAILLLVIGLSIWGINRLLSYRPAEPIASVSPVTSAAEPAEGTDAATAPKPTPEVSEEPVKDAPDTDPTGATTAPEPTLNEGETAGVEEMPEEPGAASESSQTVAEASGPDASSGEGEAAESSGPIRLKIEAIEVTWLKIIADENPPKEYSLKVGDTKVLDADKKFNLLVGNAGGIRLTLNGEKLEPLGKSGQVVNIELP